MEKSIKFSSLPYEVQINIFEYLNVRSRLNACLVCKDWLKIMDCHKLLCNVQVSFKKGFQKDFKHSFMTRQFERFSFNGIVISNSVVDFFKKYSKQFVRLKFIDCKVLNHKRKSKYRQRFLKCANLKYLEIYSSDVFAVFAFVPNVTTLKMNEICGLTDYALCQLNKTLFKLEELDICGSVIYNEADYEKFYVNGKTIETNPSKSVLSLAGVKKFIEKHKNTLKRVNFSVLRLSPEAFVTISDINGLNLKEVTFPYFLPQIFVKKFCESQFSLTSLTLIAFWDDVTDEIVSAICKCLLNLKNLFIHPNETVDESIVEIFQLEHLEVLDIRCNTAISEWSYQQAVLKLKAFKLKDLNLGSAQINDHSLCELLKRNLNIRKLVISYTSVSNETLNMICANLINLEYLDLDACTGISDTGITGEFESYSDSLTPTPLSNLKYLRSLHIGYNNSLTSNGIIKAIKFPYLRNLSLKQCYLFISHKGIQFILEKQNPRLSYFIMSFNSKQYVKSNHVWRGLLPKNS